MASTNSISAENDSNNRDTDRQKFKKDLVIKKLNQNFCLYKETFVKFKCKDFDDVLKKGRDEDLTSKEKGKIQRFTNLLYIECWKDGVYQNLQLSSIFCEELEKMLKLKNKKQLMLENCRVRCPVLEIEMKYHQINKLIMMKSLNVLKMMKV
uniref:Uncharacterized protein n=1 Tax=Strongyloides papillosus TaxID=174720 RepID=A0A0N5CE41_STREA